MSVKKLMVVQCDDCKYAIISSDCFENKIDARRQARELGMTTKVMPNGSRADFCKKCGAKFR